MSEIEVRAATAGDATRMAELHAGRITEGFLPSLGVPFLTRLYRRITRSPHSFAFVATTQGSVQGFAATTLDLGRLFRDFILRDGVMAAVVAAPRLVRSYRKVWETLRYPSATTDLPAAEILAVAVDAAAGGRGVGTRVVEASLEALRERGVAAAKVVAGSDNEAALRLYRGCGFVARERLTVHEGTSSEVLVWTSS